IITYFPLIRKLCRRSQEAFTLLREAHLVLSNLLNEPFPVSKPRSIAASASAHFRRNFSFFPEKCDASHPRRCIVAHPSREEVIWDRPSDLVLQISVFHSIPQIPPRAILKDAIVHFLERRA
ncbi:hypothetical protein ALC60_13859, partial [Trachymyrmex zeteki]